MPKGLTRRQREVLLLYANGSTQRQIARWLGISQDTVASILARAYRTLGVTTGPQAVAVALALGELGVHQIHIPQEQRDTAA